jgi:DNA-binding response OmpR family regulator
MSFSLDPLMTPPTYKHRILYVGMNLALLNFLKDALKHLDCFIVRCPYGSPSHTLIKSDIKYSLLLLDDELPDTTGQELKDFARSLAHRKRTPIIIFKKSDDFNQLVKTIIQSLATRNQAG